MTRTSLAILEELRWELMYANDCLDGRIWERLQHLTQALDLVDELEEVVEGEIRKTVHDLRLWWEEPPPGWELDKEAA